MMAEDERGRVCVRELRRADRACPSCRDVFSMWTNQVYCSPRCRTRAYARRKRRGESPRQFARWMIARPGQMVRSAARCPGCYATVAERVGPTALVLAGHRRVLVQQLADGRLVAAAECACGSFIRVTLAAPRTAVGPPTPP